MAECHDSTPTKSIERVCGSPSSKEQICLLCAKVVSNSDFRRKLTTSGSWEKAKTCFNIESILGKEIPSDCFVTNILCRNCADRNETHVRKLHGSPWDSQILFSLSDLKYPLAVPPSNRLLRTML